MTFEGLAKVQTAELYSQDAAVDIPGVHLATKGPTNPSLTKKKTPENIRSCRKGTISNQSGSEPEALDWLPVRIDIKLIPLGIISD